MRSSLVPLLTLLAGAIAAPSPAFVLHEKRYSLPSGWTRTNRVASHEVLPMRVGLSQSNLDKAEEYLLDVSDPASPNYGKHWSAKQVAETFAPSQDSIDAVKEWLTSSGIPEEDIDHHPSKGWFKFDIPVGKAEELLKTTFYRHQHETGKAHIGCDEYHVPEHLVRHVDFITPTIHFDTKLHQAVVKRDAATSTAAAGVPVKTKAAVNILKNPNGGFLPKKGESLGLLKNIITELENCNKFITPDCLRALYLFPPGLTANPKNSYGIVEYTRKLMCTEKLKSNSC